jgi:hypothetical protein
VNIVSYLEKQLTNINALLHDIVGDINQEEWLARAAPGQNRLGFIIWHIARTQDTIVQSWIRGEVEIVHRPEWNHWEGLRPYGMGAGITLAEADEVAATVHHAESLLYADTVHQEIIAWLRQRSDDELDQIPDANANLGPYPEYQAEGFRQELGSLYNQPIWNLLMRPCIGHIHRHLGELQLAKDVLRARG